jgi:4,5-dihydroxyphthalate decarboxylase
MADVKLDIAFWDYDRTRALSDGNIRIAGVDAKYHSGSNVTEIFRSMVAERRFDVSELGLTFFLRTFKGGESPFVAIPVFPVRAFRHSAIFVNTNSGINEPEDLNGKTIGDLRFTATMPVSCQRAS